MEDKIRINITQKTFDILKKDMRNFEFLKSDDTVNTNAFINRLIVNYHEDFKTAQEKRLQTIMDKGIEEEMAHVILDSLSDEENADDSNCCCTISFRPIASNSAVIGEIECNELAYTSRSSYYRRMFESYCSFSQDRRERIIFADLVETINSAIQKSRKLFLLTKGKKDRGESGINVSPYAIAQGKEELFNYLLVQEHTNSRARTYRLCRIHSLREMREHIEFTEPAKTNLSRMLKNGPQFYYRDDENKNIVVELTDKGIRNFSSFFVHRPEPIDKIGNRYVFDCSILQAFNYFSRFGEDANVISPISLRVKLKYFYQNALEKYRNRIQDDC